MSDDLEYSPLSARDREILRVLLSRPFPGRDELVAQVDAAEGCWITYRHVPALLLRVPEGAPLAAVEQRTPLEAEGVAKDADGGVIRLSLHVVDGKLSEIEYLREDGAPIQRVPEPSEIKPAYE